MLTAIPQKKIPVPTAIRNHQIHNPTPLVLPLGLPLMEDWVWRYALWRLKQKAMRTMESGTPLVVVAVVERRRRG
ncbi:steroid reductase DET2 isoform X1 [Iris pallida]|uniref:Steroid reductase DET2 isoform X1 n=1 Tax=Iris pallida TaxID=29817 RepID=A0AAX6E437_IRIPA|nr:steroid reductase DET2 isoform X1 [Iris pallida]